MDMNDKILLRKRSLIETVNDELKNICPVEHSRHRSVINFMTNLVAAIIAYNFLPKKPSLKYEILKISHLAYFYNRTQVFTKNPESLFKNILAKTSQCFRNVVASLLPKKYVFDQTEKLHFYARLDI